jgi:hypothetical protein
MHKPFVENKKINVITGVPPPRGFGYFFPSSPIS